MISKLKTKNSKLKTLTSNLVFFILIFTFFFIKEVYAHKVNIYAYAEDGKIHSESYFADGSKCKNSILEVFDEKDKTKLLEGKTDDEGRFSFKIPKATSIKLVLHASMGHQAEFIIGEDEVREAMGIKSQKREARESKMNQRLIKEERRDLTQVHQTLNQDIETIIDNAVDKKLQPVIRMLVKMQEESGKPGITEIIGGIGYIIGILGIIAYFKARKNKK